MFFEITDRVAPATLARITGGLYVSFIAVSVLADALGHIGLGDAQQMYGALTTSPGLFRLGLVAAFVSAFLFLMTAWGLYVLLRTVNTDLSLLFLLRHSREVLTPVAADPPSLLPALAGDAVDAYAITPPPSPGCTAADHRSGTGYRPGAYVAALRPWHRRVSASATAVRCRRVRYHSAPSARTASTVAAAPTR